MPPPAEITVASRLQARPDRVWDRVITPAGINDELRPVMRMTVPRGFERLDPATVELGRPLGRSWVLLFGLVPVDFDEITLVRLEEGHGFLERSRLLSQRVWEHERTLEPAADGGCLLTDRVRWEPRMGLPGWPLRPLFRAIFRHRHSRLRRRFGGVAA